MASFPTQDEIVARVRALRERDMFGFETSEYLDWLDFEHAREFLKEDASPEKWKDRPFAPTAERVIEAIREYMPFAWEKANDRRGISAWRSLAHMKAWLWLLGERAAAERLDGYDRYGKPQLRAICERYDIDWQSLDDGRWTNDESDHGVPAEAAAAAPLFAENVA